MWPEMFRAIQQIRPRWIVGENVFGIVNWSEGLVFEQVCSDMENEGYEVQPFVLPACGVDAPHRRDRVWFVAHRADSGSEGMCRREDGLHADAAPAYADSQRRKKRFTPAESGQKRWRNGENGSRLNPLFIAEMMGFPVDWTALPFQVGAGNPSKPTATP